MRSEFRETIKQNDEHRDHWWLMTKISLEQLSLRAISCLKRPNQRVYVRSVTKLSLKRLKRRETTMASWCKEKVFTDVRNDDKLCLQLVPVARKISKGHAEMSKVQSNGPYIVHQDVKIYLLIPFASATDVKLSEEGHISEISALCKNYTALAPEVTEMLIHKNIQVSKAS